MSFIDFLRRAFLLPPRDPQLRDQFPDHRNHPWDPDEEDHEDGFFGAHSRPFGFENFNVFSGDIMEMHKYFEQQLNELMRTFTSHGPFNFDGTFDDRSFGGNMLPPPPDNSLKPSHPQDRYLKPHFDNSPSVKVDTDLDSQLERDGLDSVLTPRSSPVVPKSHFSSQSHSTRIFFGPDGKVERQETVKRPDGGISTTVTRRLGDKEHSFTTNTAPDGSVTTDEKFVNMDESWLHSFNKIWTNSLNGPTNQPNSSQTPDYFRRDDFMPSSNFLDSFFKIFK